MSNNEDEKPYIPPVLGAMHLSRFDQPTGDFNRGFAPLSDLYAELHQLTKMANEVEFTKSFERFSDGFEGGRETRELYEKIRDLLGPMPKTWTDATRDYLSNNYGKALQIGVRLLKYIDVHPEHEEARQQIVQTVTQIVVETDSVLCLARHAEYMKSGRIPFNRYDQVAQWAHATAYSTGARNPEQPDISKHIERSHQEVEECWKLLFSGKAHRFFSAVFEQKDTQIPGLYYALTRAINLSNLIQTETILREDQPQPSVQANQAAQLLLDHLLGELLSVRTYQTTWESQHNLGFELNLGTNQVGNTEIAPELISYLNKTLDESRVLNLQTFLLALVSGNEGYLQNDANLVKLVDNLLFWKALERCNHPQINALYSFHNFAELALDVFPYIEKHPKFKNRFNEFLSRYPDGFAAFNRIMVME